MAASAPNSSPPGGTSTPLLAPSTATTWATALGLQLNVLNDHLKTLAPEMYADTPQEDSLLLHSEAETVAGSAAIDNALAALAPFVKIHAQLSSIRSTKSHSPLHTSPNATSNLNKYYPISPSSRQFERQDPGNSRKRPTAPTYAQVAATFVPASAENAQKIARPRPDRANRQAAALFNVPDPGRIVFARLQFSGYNQTAPIANMAILRRALADANYRASSVLIPLEDSSILVGARKNTLEALTTALDRVVKSFSCAIPQLCYELQAEVNWLSGDAPSPVHPQSVRNAISQELDRLQCMAAAWKSRPFFETALKSFADILGHTSTESLRANEASPQISHVPFSRKRTQNPTIPGSAEGPGTPNTQRARLSGCNTSAAEANPETPPAATGDNDTNMQ